MHLYVIAADAGSQNPLVPTWTELIIGIIAFLIVFGFLGRLLLPRAQKMLQERTEKIEGGLQRAEEAQAEANRVLEQYRQQLADARHEASRLREEAREQGAQIIAEMRAEAQAEARRLTEAANARGEEFGERGLVTFLAAHKLDPSASVVERLAHHVRSWSGNSSFADDFTVVLVRRC